MQQQQKELRLTSQLQRLSAISPWMKMMRHLIQESLYQEKTKKRRAKRMKQNRRNKQKKRRRSSNQMRLKLCKKRNQRSPKILRRRPL